MQEPFIPRLPTAGSLQGHRSQAQLPEGLRKKFCLVLFTDFRQVQEEAGQNVPYDSMAAAQRKSREGQILPLILHLYASELRMERGGQQQATGDELREVFREASIAVRALNEQEVHNLYLDKQLSWPRVQKLLHEAVRKTRE